MSEPFTSKHIAILGAGKIALAAGRLWLAAGHSLCFGVRAPERHAASTEALGPRASVTSVARAAAAGEIVLLAVPYAAVELLLPSLRAELAGKLVMDATNPFGLSSDGRIVSTLGPGITAGSRMAALLPQSRVVRAFTHVMDELLVSRGTAQAGLWAMAIAGDDPAAKHLAAGLVRDAGFVPVDVGTLADSAPLDPGGALFPHMYTEADMRAVLAGLTAPMPAPQRSASLR